MVFSGKIYFFFSNEDFTWHQTLHLLFFYQSLYIIFWSVHWEMRHIKDMKILKSLKNFRYSAKQLKKNFRNIQNFHFIFTRVSSNTHLKDKIWRIHFDHNCLIFIAWRAVSGSGSKERSLGTKSPSIQIHVFLQHAASDQNTFFQRLQLMNLCSNLDFWKRA